MIVNGKDLIRFMDINDVTSALDDIDSLCNKVNFILTDQIDHGKKAKALEELKRFQQDVLFSIFCSFNTDSELIKILKHAWILSQLLIYIGNQLNASTTVDSKDFSFNEELKEFFPDFLDNFLLLEWNCTANRAILFLLVECNSLFSVEEMLDILVSLYNVILNCLISTVSMIYSLQNKVIKRCKCQSGCHNITICAILDIIRKRLESGR